MPNEWYLNPEEISGPDSGKELSGGIVRLSDDGKSYEFLAVVARAEVANPEDTLHFPAFAYNGLIWHVNVDAPYGPGKETIQGGWRNNKFRQGPPAEDEGTYTGQSGPGTPEDCKEDAASASA
ncbi:MAG TPA: hypothetical protein VHQ94_20030 [Pyrinomonadaceae bacterium]|jgi:hypothetical protein|nr:hypothetical protein [Pyrinomonadaceae bacterium]